MNTFRRKSLIVTGLIVLLSVPLLVPWTAAQTEPLGLLRIVKADYPIQVPHSYSFQVRLRVEYAFRDYMEIHVAVYEGTRGVLDHPLWESSAENLTEVGQKTYNAQLKSPSKEGQWLITGYALFRNASGVFYFSDEASGPGFVDMSIKVTDEAKLTLQAPYGNVPITVDGSTYSTDSDGILVREIKVLAEHSIMAPDIFSVAEGWRAIFNGWNGSDLTNPKTLTITSDTVLEVGFRDEFYLDVVSEVGEVRGAGWYPSGAVANFSVSSASTQSKGWEGVLGVEQRFIGWTGDVDSSAPNESVVMNRPHRVVAGWTVEYERLYYLVIVLAVLVVAGGLGVLLRRTLPRRAAETAEGAAGTAEPSVGMFCIFCGSEIDHDAKFCSKCGKSLVNSD